MECALKKVKDREKVINCQVILAKFTRKVQSPPFLQGFVVILLNEAFVGSVH